MTAKVLVVEDDPDLRESVVELLALEGFSTEQAENGCAALRLLRREPAVPDLILLDLMMPVMNGWNFREAQLADPALAPIPVVVMSAQDCGDVEAHAKLQKPFEVADLLRAISQASPAEP
ncbi:response regulator [Anaeromyxobacter terrae]|uniref:response regulator n=1 Tax=Anaeromyxobacter terrae TaxID=2925406 RepID=UPI001F576BC1|nr:response regulator [Anaeromyxobacter sp. SG22]